MTSGAVYKSPELCNSTTGDNSLVLYYLEEDAPSVDVFCTHVLLCIKSQFSYSIMQRVVSLGYAVVAVIGSFVGIGDNSEDIVRYLVLVSK